MGLSSYAIGLSAYPAGTMIVIPMLLALAFQNPFEGGRTFAMGLKDAYLMAPPETVSGSETQDMLWTADGTNLVVERSALGGSPTDFATAMVMGRKAPPDLIARLQPRFEMVVWSVASRRSHTVVSVAGEQGAAFDLKPMAGTDRVVFSTFQRIPATPVLPARIVSGFTMLAAGSGTLVRLSESTVNEGEASDGEESECLLSPTRPLGALVRREAGKRSVQVRFFGPEGRPGAWLPTALPQRPEFDAQGFPGYPVATKVAGKTVVRFQRILPATGGLGAVVDYEPAEKSYDAATMAPVAIVAGTPTLLPQTAPKPVEKPLLEVVSMPSIAPRPAPDAPSIMLFVRGGKPEEAGVVTTDGSKGLLSPKLDVVAYVHQGVAMVRSLVKVPREVVEKAREDALKAVAISNAKQAALGVLMFAADNDDTLPSQSVDIQSKIYPYVKSRDILSGFNYTFGGGVQNSIQDPASTELGYVTGPGGRAVAYADGHVKWIPDNP